MGADRAGVWPVMLTPFEPGGAVDERGLRALVDWYIDHGVQGLFAACQSSEIFHMDRQEHLRITRITLDQAAGRVPVVASGFTQYGLQEQAETVCAMADLGVEAVILISNRLAAEGDPDEVLLERLERLYPLIGDGVKLGLYECPSPYKRLLSLPVIREVARTGRFHFLKDTCCDAATLRERLRLLEGTELKLFNANATTLLSSLLDGAAGYSGVMANFHPELYVWLTRNPRDPRAPLVQAVLTMASLIERQLYPANAKFHLRAVEGLPVGTLCRVQDASLLSETFRDEVFQMDRLCGETARRLGIGEAGA